ncbi:MAG: hypothetical protein J6A75_05365 [Lachnospiraceae bacterium]|nr:hypothetical protein [Lachnospiraceae bacterium]
MSRYIRIVLSIAIYLFGVALAIYVGGWILIVKPVKNTIVAYTLGNLTIPQLIINVIKCICSLTVAGFIWSLGYIASNLVYDSRDEKSAV